MLELLQNHVKTQLMEHVFSFKFFKLGNVFESLTKEDKKHIFALKKKPCLN